MATPEYLIEPGHDTSVLVFDQVRVKPVASGAGRIARTAKPSFQGPGAASAVVRCTGVSRRLERRHTIPQNRTATRARRPTTCAGCPDGSSGGSSGSKHPSGCSPAPTQPPWAGSWVVDQQMHMVVLAVELHPLRFEVATDASEDHAKVVEHLFRKDCAPIPGHEDPMRMHQKYAVPSMP